MTSRPHRRHWLASFAFLALLTPFFASAQMIFELADIRIDSPEISEKDKTPKQPHAPATYHVEVRTQEALKLEYIHTLNTLTESGGVLITLKKPASVSLPAMKVYTPVDVLFLGDDGRVLQIMPAITLGELTQSPQAHGLVKAFLFLKSGETAARGLHAQDIVAGSMFTPPLPVEE